MKAIVKPNYLSPTDVIEKYPELKFKHDWTPSIVGSFLRYNLVKGYYDQTRKSAMIEENSVLNLIQYLNNSIEGQKIKL
jgi:hypothetical protein